MRQSVDEMLAAARERITRLSPAEAAAEMVKGATLIDTRCSEDRTREGFVPGAVNYPLSVLEWRVDPDSDTRDEAIAHLDASLILMCSDGYSSSLAGSRLMDLGFEKVFDVDGGFRAWKAAGLPVN